MRKVLVCVLAMAWVAGAIGCGGGPSATEKEFQKLYKQYSARFHEKMVVEAETLQPIQVTAEAARIWDDVFATHKEVLKHRVEEILRDMDTAPPIQEDQYLEIASGSRQEPPPDQPQGIILKQFLWSPIGAAQMGLNNWLSRLLQPNSFAVRSVLTANAQLMWDVIDRNIDRPKLVLKQGPMVFVIDLSRKDDYYQVDKIRWLRPRSMGPIMIPQPPAAASGALPPSAASGALPPPSGLPSGLPPAMPPAGPAIGPPATTTPALPLPVTPPAAPKG